MKKIGCILLFGLGLSACSSRDPQNAYEEVREARNQQAEITRMVDEKREAYTADFGDLTFTGEADDLTNVMLEPTTGAVTLGLPRYYHFIENDNQLLLEVHIIDGEEGEHFFEDIFETLVVEAIEFEEDTYKIYAEDYTFELHMLQDSIRRLRDEGGEILRPFHYIPENLEEQWYKEARNEVGSSD